MPSWQLKRETSFNAFPDARHCIMCYKLRSHAVCTFAEGSVAAPTASLTRRSRVAPASQRQQRRSVDPASQRRSVAASQRRSDQQRRSVAASERQQRRSVTCRASQRCSVTASPALASVAASQRRSATRPPERRSVAAPPALGASQRNVGNPRFGPLGPCTAKSRKIWSYCMLLWHLATVCFSSRPILSPRLH